jgi:hypothetical protein
VNEKAISEQFVEQFGSRFDLYPERYLRHPFLGDPLRIDYIGFDREGELLGPVGFEVKDQQRWTGQGSFTAFTAAVKQCIDYTEMVIHSQFPDEKYKQWHGQRMKFVFLYCVDKTWGYDLRTDDNIRSNRAAGVLRLAGKSGVGVACYDDFSSDWLLTIGGHRAFSLRGGMAPLMFKHNVANRKGSAV